MVMCPGAYNSTQRKKKLRPVFPEVRHQSSTEPSNVRRIGLKWLQPRCTRIQVCFHLCRAGPHFANTVITPRANMRSPRAGSGVFGGDHFAAGFGGPGMPFFQRASRRLEGGRRTRSNSGVPPQWRLVLTPWPLVFTQNMRDAGRLRTGQMPVECPQGHSWSVGGIAAFDIARPFTRRFGAVDENWYRGVLSFRVSKSVCLRMRGIFPRALRCSVHEKSAGVWIRVAAQVGARIG